MLVATGGHLHPGGLWTDLYLERGGRKVRLFRSRAKYFEPAGAVSWDVAMEVTPAEWRVGVKAGDVLSVNATYDSKRASWYEAMGIMQVAFNPGGSGPDPFATDVDVRGPAHARPPEREPQPRRRLRRARRPAQAAGRAGAAPPHGGDQRLRLRRRRPAADGRAAAGRRRSAAGAR